MNIIINGKPMTVFRTVHRPHGWIDLMAGKSCAEGRYSVPVNVYRHGGSIFTSGNRITIPRGEQR